MSHLRRRLADTIRTRALPRALMSVAAWIAAPRRPVGAVAAVFNSVGDVLLVEHLLRTDFPWGLPGGWIGHGERPEDAVVRELTEELGLSVDHLELVAVDAVSRVHRSTHPNHLGLGFYARTDRAVVQTGWEVLAWEWADPREVGRELAPFQARVLELALARSRRGGP
jgi:8-oxo-dGTP diphosphatase